MYSYVVSNIHYVVSNVHYAVSTLSFLSQHDFCHGVYVIKIYEVEYNTHEGLEIGSSTLHYNVNKK